MSLPFTTAQTSGPGADSFLQPAASPHASNAGEISSILRADGKCCGEAAVFRRLFSPTRADASGANTHTFVRAVDDGLDAAEIRIPAAAGDIVSVADRIAEARFLAAEFTCECH